MSSRWRLVVLGLVAGANCARSGTVGKPARRWARVSALLAGQQKQIIVALVPQMAEQLLDVLAAGEVKLVPQERVQQRAVGEEVVPLDFAATLTLIDWSELAPKRFFERTVEQIDDLLVPQVMGIVEVVQQRFSERTGEDGYGLPVPQVRHGLPVPQVRDVVEVVGVSPQERISERTVEQVPQVVEEILEVARVSSRSAFWSAPRTRLTTCPCRSCRKKLLSWSISLPGAHAGAHQGQD